MSYGVTNKCFPPANKCFNCCRKGHDARPGRTGDTGKEYKRCTGCRLMTYCDQDCQREHWIRIHERHCRFLEGRKQHINSEHNSQTCLLCVEKRNSSQYEMFSITSPKMDCHIEDVNSWMKDGLAATFGFHAEGKTCSCPSPSWPGQLPFTLGEVSGHYIGEGRDEMMAHALKLVLAMQLKVKEAKIHIEIERLLLMINEGRLDLWCDLLVYGRIASTLTMYPKTEALARVLDSLKSYLDASNPWWTALRFTLLILNSIEVHSNSMMKTDILGEKNKDDPRFKTLREVTKYDESQYKNAVFASTNNLLSSFKVWPKLVNKSLVVLLPSDLDCQICGDKVGGQLSLDEDENHPQTQHSQWIPSIGVNGSFKVYCSLSKNPNCVREGAKENVRHNTELNKDQWKVYVDEYDLFIKLSRFCDQCFQRSISSHRCSGCHAVQYCSKECQHEDLEFHKSVCSKWAKDESKTLGSSREQRKYWKAVTDKAKEKD